MNKFISCGDDGYDDFMEMTRSMATNRKNELRLAVERDMLECAGCRGGLNLAESVLNKMEGYCDYQVKYAHILISLMNSGVYNEIADKFNGPKQQ